jgi:hypothetical protein
VGPDGIHGNDYTLDAITLEFVTEQEEAAVKRTFRVR